MEKNRRKPYFLKISVQEEMVALEKQLEASQRFLHGVRSLASYEDIQQKQLKGLQFALDKTKDLSTSQAAVFLESIDSRLWSKDAMQELKHLVASKTSQVEADGERRKMQDFSQISQFLTQEVATMILDGKASAQQVMRALCLHAGRMPLRVPSEFTMAVLVTVSNWQQKVSVRKTLVAMEDVIASTFFCWAGTVLRDTLISRNRARRNLCHKRMTDWWLCKHFWPCAKLRRSWLK